MKQPRLFKVVRLPDGRLAKVPIKPSQETCKRERRIIKDVESGLWLYKHRYEYQDHKQRDQTS